MKQAANQPNAPKPNDQGQPQGNGSDGSPIDDDQTDQLADQLAEFDDSLKNGSPDSSALLGDRSTADLTSTILRLEKHWPRRPNPAQQAGDPAGDAPLREVKIGRFEILREIGRGGFGVVFLARDPQLNRMVALKVPRPEVLVDEGQRQRFASEAEAAALLDHPAIVPIYEANPTGPTPYIASAYCAGPDLRQWLDQHGKVDNWQAAAALMVTLAAGVHYAHIQGVYHRDIKPSNVLLVRKDHEEPPSAAKSSDRQLENFDPRLTDFGLAKLVESSLQDTHSSIMLGTPLYMALEQFEGNVEADQVAAVDVYALGCLFFELLTAATPNAGSSYVELLDRLRNEKPVRLRDHTRSAPLDLETICRKCLEKRPNDRYRSADALATDLRNVLAGRPIDARPWGFFKRSTRWIRRHRNVAALAAMIVISASAMAFNARWQSDRSVSALAANKELQQRVDTQEQTERLKSYAYGVRQAGKYWHQHNLAEMQRELEAQLPRPGEEDLRCFVWHYLWRRCNNQLTTYRGHSGIVSDVAFSPDGSRIATSGHDGTARLYETESGRGLGVLRGHQNEVNCLAFCGDGNHVVTGDGGGLLRLWNIETLEQVQVVQAEAEDLLCLAVTPDAQVLATGGTEGVVRLWSSTELLPLGTIMDEKELGWIRSLTFSPDGTQVAFGENNKTARIWDWREPKQLHKYTDHSHWVTSVDFHPDGSRLISGCAGGFVSMRTETKSYWTRGLNERIRAVRYAPDGELLAIAGNVNQVKIWHSDDLENSKDVPTAFEIMAQNGNVWDVAFSPDGKSLATAGADGLSKRWRVGDQRFDETWETASRIQFADFVLQKGLLAQVYDDGVRVFQHPGYIEVSHFALPDQHDVNVIAISPNGQHLGMVGEGSRLTVVPLQGEGETKTFGAIVPGFYNYLAFSADSRTVYACDGTSVVAAYPVTGSAAPIKTYAADERFRFTRIEQSPCGRWLFAGDTIKENAAFLIDLDNGSVNKLPVKFGKAAAFSPAGRFLAMSSNDGPIQLWDLEEERLWSTFPNAGKRAVFMAFTPDGKILAYVGSDLQLRFWSVELGEELLTIPISSFPDFGIAFSDDGQTLISEDYIPGVDGNDNKWKFGRFLSYSAADPN